MPSIFDELDSIDYKTTRKKHTVVIKVSYTVTGSTIEDIEDAFTDFITDKMHEFNEEYSGDITVKDWDIEEIEEE